jgi:SpoIID/LytB domain protein
MDRDRRITRRGLAGLAAALLAASGATLLDAPQAGALTVSPGGALTVVMLGNGHGHGMSQYGARGAAIAGLGTARILRFYYPGTTLVNDRRPRIRVQISGAGARLTVVAVDDLTVTGSTDPLPSAGVREYRLAQGAGSGLVLQRLDDTPGATWTRVGTGLPDGATFHRTSWAPLRLVRPGGAETDYFGFLSAFRNTASGRAGGVTTVNRVGLDNYTAGVVSSEMPTTWQRAAVNAQAVAARTYGAYAMAHPQSRHYDICDTSWCQVYGGHDRYDAAGQQVWSDYRRAARATANEVLEYDGSPVFAQFSASNGGWTVAGDEPYLQSRQDPYDNSTSGDPYLYYRRKVSISALASALGLKTITQVAVTSRDGNGTWQGRVLAGYVVGTDGSGAATRLSLSGSDFAAAFGIGTTWFALRTT